MSPGAARDRFLQASVWRRSDSVKPQSPFREIRVRPFRLDFAEAIQIRAGMDHELSQVLPAHPRDRRTMQAFNQHCAAPFVNAQTVVEHGIDEAEGKDKKQRITQANSPDPSVSATT